MKGIFMKSKIKPYHDYLYVEKLEDQTMNSSGIIVSKQNKFIKLKVLSVSEEVVSKDISVEDILLAEDMFEPEGMGTSTGFISFKYIVGRIDG